MGKFLIVGVDFKTTRTKMGLVDLREGRILETIISLTEKNDVDKLLLGIEHGLEIFHKKSELVQGTIAGIGILWPEHGTGVNTASSLWQTIDEQLLKRIIEKRFSLACRIDSENKILALAASSYGVSGENAGIMGCSALFN